MLLVFYILSIVSNNFEHWLTPRILSSDDLLSSSVLFVKLST